MQDIPGYEGLYAVTRNGNVWSYPKKRSSKNGKWIKLQLVTSTKNRVKPRSCYVVNLYKNKKRKSYQVHRLVAITYILNPDNKPDINHINGNSLVNEDWNLEWCIAKENMEHAQRTGLLNQHTEKQRKGRIKSGKLTGAANGKKSRCIFSIIEVACIRELYKTSKRSFRSIAKDYDCSAKTIGNICNYKSYLT